MLTTYVIIKNLLWRPKTFRERERIMPYLTTNLISQIHHKWEKRKYYIIVIQSIHAYTHIMVISKQYINLGMGRHFTNLISIKFSPKNIISTKNWKLTQLERQTDSLSLTKFFFSNQNIEDQKCGHCLYTT